MDLTYKVALEVATHEAIIRKAYKDSVDVWTWSVGLTSATGHDVTRYIDNPAPLERCLEVYVWALDRYADQVREAFAGHELTEAQFAAALSFHWNTGGIKRASWVRLWKAGKIAEAREAFMNWRSPPEIVERRRKERDLFFDGVWAQDGYMVEYTRLTKRYTPVWSSARRIDVRDALGEALKRHCRGAAENAEDFAPDPDAEVPVPTLSPATKKAAEAPVRTTIKSPDGSASIIGAIGAIGAVAAEAAKEVEPLIAYSETLKWLFLGLTLLGIAGATVAKVKRTAEGG